MVPPNLNATWPAVTAAAGLPEVTVAVNVTDWPEPDGFCEDETVVIVAAEGTVTTTELLSTADCVPDPPAQFAF